MKNIKTILLVALMSVASYGGYTAYEAVTMTEVERALMENVEALTKGERPPSWWDYFNNYVVEERINVSSSNCTGGTFKYKDMTFNVGSCWKYSIAIINHCYDGGDRDECSSRSVDYI